MSGQLLAAFLSTAHPWSVEVTGYCPCGSCCGRSADGITASGAKAEGKLVAADKAVPFGTLIYVPGYSDNPAPVLDRGGAIKGNRLDLLFPTHAQAAKWGRRSMTVYISIRPPAVNDVTVAKGGATASDHSAEHPRVADASPAKAQTRNVGPPVRAHGQDAAATPTTKASAPSGESPGAKSPSRIAGQHAPGVRFPSRTAGDQGSYPVVVRRGPTARPPSDSYVAASWGRGAEPWARERPPARKVLRWERLVFYSVGPISPAEIRLNIQRAMKGALPNRSIGGRLDALLGAMEVEPESDDFEWRGRTDSERSPWVAIEGIE
jgi:3D (Asp-Asp-Asp) domain-containing protein